MATTTKSAAQRAKQAFDKFKDQLDDAGFDGDPMDIGDVTEFAAKSGMSFGKDQREKYSALIDAVKSFKVDQTAPNALSVVWEDDMAEASADMEEDEMPPPEQKNAGGALARKYKNLETKFESLKAKVDGGLRVEVSVPGEADWRARKRFGTNVFETADEAHRFGTWVLANSGVFDRKRPERVEQARKSLQSMYGEKALTTAMGSAGPLIPAEFSNTIINIQKQYGVMRRICQIEPMGSDTKTVGRHPDGSSYTGYFPDEGGTLTAEDMQLEGVQLRARKHVILQVVSSETMDDTTTALGELIAEEIARGNSKKEDECGLIGDGTSTYGRINGIIPQFGTSATADARSVTGGTTSDAHTKANLLSVRAKLSDEHRDGAIWLCSAAMKSFIIENIASQSGGMSLGEFAGKPYDTLWGDPIVTTNVMNSNDNTGGDVIDLLYLNPRNAGLMGDRKTLEIDANTNAYWTSDQIGIRGISRFDFNWFNLGSTTVAGAVVALWQT